jgi:hypothetical protein
MRQALACIVLALVLTAAAQAQVAGGTGTVGYQLGVYGRVRVDVPVYPATRQLDRLSFIAALNSTHVFDYIQDAQNVEMPSRTTGGIADTIATVVIDNSFSSAEPNVRVRVTVYSWHGDDCFVVKYTLTNTNTSPYTLTLGGFVVPKPSNTYGGETVAYDATKKVSYFFRTAQTPYVGVKVLSGDPSSFHALDWDAYSPNPSSDAATDSTRYWMATQPGFDGPLTAGVNGSAFNLNAGQQTVAAGASVTVFYGVMFTNSLSDLLLEADSAQVRYNSIINVDIHDIGMSKIREQAAGALFENGVVQPRAVKTETGNGPALFVEPSSTTTENAPVSLYAIVQNSGSFVENSYQIGWEVDGVPQPLVNNTEPLTVGDADTLSFVWPLPTAGLHLLRAWTILGTDTVRANDTSGVAGVFITPPYAVLEERFNGTFPPAGWTTINRDGSTGDSTTGPWAEGQPSRFAALEGPENGFAGDEYTTANGLYIDDYLITPNTGGPPDPGAVDSLIFFARSYDSPYPDSLAILVSTTNTDTASFTQLGYVEVPKTGWTRFAYSLPITANRYIAFRYLLYDGGSAGTNSVYIGLDIPHIIRYGATTTSVNVTLGTGWNIVSNPVVTPGDSMRTLFPLSVFDYGFGFSGTSGYEQAYQLQAGKGYWGKMSGAHTTTISGGVQNSVTVPLTAGWNMVGSLSAAIDTSAAHVSTTPPGLRSSNWFKYKTAPSAGYDVTTDILPGSAYWVKASAAGSVTLALNLPGVPGGQEARNEGKSINDLNTLTITDARGTSQTLYFGADREQAIPVAMYELPPAPPDGLLDARFANGGMVQTLTGDAAQADFPIRLNAGAYPLTVAWDIRDAAGRYTLADAAGSTVPQRMDGQGSLRITRPSAGLLIRANADGMLPATFSLGQNYPNPFNPSTTITFALPVDGRVRAEIFDVLGRNVVTLLNEDRPAGYHSLVWDGTNAAGRQLGSGTYFLRLSVDGGAGKSFKDTRKMMLMK